MQPKPVTSETISEVVSVNSEIVLKYLRKIKQNKAEGPDDIHARLLRECENQLAVPLAIFFLSHLRNLKSLWIGKELTLFLFIRRGIRV